MWEFLVSVIDAISQPVLIWDKNLQFLFGNQPFYHLTGWSQLEMERDPLCFLGIPSRQKFSKFLQELDSVPSRKIEPKLFPVVKPNNDLMYYKIELRAFKQDGLDSYYYSIFSPPVGPEEFKKTLTQMKTRAGVINSFTLN
jgi:PAS domain-containing protein